MLILVKYWRFIGKFSDEIAMLSKQQLKYYANIKVLD